MELPILMGFVLLAGCVQGSVGFGFGLVAMGTLPLWIGPKEAVPLVALLCLAVNGVLTFRLRAYLTRSRLAPMIGGCLFGVPIGVTLFVRLNATLLMVGLGLALVAVALQQGLQNEPMKDRAPPSPLWGGLAGLASGILGGAFNTGGPPAVMYVGVQRWSKEHTMATLQGFFLTTCVVQIGLFVAQGTIAKPQVVAAMTLLIPALIGVAMGQMFFQRIDQERFRVVLISGIGLLGVAMLLKSGRTLLG